MVKSTLLLTKAQKTNLLKEWWCALPKGIQLYARDIIVHKCNSTVNVWYHWIKGNSEIPVEYLSIIEQIAQEPIFRSNKFKKNDSVFNFKTNLL